MNPMVVEEKRFAGCFSLLVVWALMVDR